MLQHVQDINDYPLDYVIYFMATLPKHSHPLLEITIEGADFFLEQTQDEHNTEEFESGQHLVVRRGAEIKFQVSV